MKRVVYFIYGPLSRKLNLFTFTYCPCATLLAVIAPSCPKIDVLRRVASAVRFPRSNEGKARSARRKSAPACGPYQCARASRGLRGGGHRRATLVRPVEQTATQPQRCRPASCPATPGYSRLNGCYISSAWRMRPAGAG